HRGQKAEAGHGPSEHPLVYRGEALVDPAPEGPQDPGGGDGRNGDEEAGNEADLEPGLHHFDYDMTRRNPQTRRRALVTGGAVRPEWDALLDVNLRAAFFCAQAAVARMRAGGHIVNVGDAWARGAPAGWSAYAASKAGLEALTRVLAAELRPRGIAVNCVAPGPVLKPERLAPARWRAITRGRAARPADVVAAGGHFATCAPSVTGRV